MTSPVHHTMVIGGGINGLSTLFHLERLGCSPLGLLEQFPLGHEHGSSHGRSRTLRTAYINPVYIALMHVALAQEWPRLEQETGSTLIHPTPGCFFGPPGGKQEGYARSAKEAGANVDEIDARAATERFPQFRFDKNHQILIDHDAALVAAADTIASLKRFAIEKELPLYENTHVTGIDFDANPIRIDTNSRTYQTERLVITAGPWTSRLLPFLKPNLQIARQTVGYFEMAGNPVNYQIPNFPVWGNLGEDKHGVFYGLPVFQRNGIKVARHVTAGLDDDPDEFLSAKSQDVDELRQFLDVQLRGPVTGFAGAETCLYTNTETEDFIIDLHPRNSNVVIGAGFSGHGFKFGPLTGKLLAELALNGKTTVSEFEAARSIFSVQPEDTK